MQLAFVMGDHADNPAVRGYLQQLVGNDLDSSYLRQAVSRAVQGQELIFLREILGSAVLRNQSESAEQLLAAITMSAYRSLRGDLTTDKAANPMLLELLGLVRSRSNSLEWQQIAMLKALGELIFVSGFKPAMLEAAPPLFADNSISENSALWDARLAGRRAFTWPGDELAQGLKPLSAEQTELMAKGEAFYGTCAACHGAAGGGVPGLAPPLAGVHWVTGPAEWLSRIILQGMSGPVVVKGETWNGVMPPHAHLAALDNETLAGLMTYLRRSWGNAADSVSVDAVAAIRTETADRKMPWTAEELEAVPFYSKLSRFAGVYLLPGLGVQMHIVEHPSGLRLRSKRFNLDGPLTAINDTIFIVMMGERQQIIEFVAEEDGTVDHLLMHVQGQQMGFERKYD